MQGALSWHVIWRYVHITAGFVGLGVFSVPVFAKKGAPVHVWGGPSFALCAYVVGATAVISSAWALADPIGFIVDARRYRRKPRCRSKAISASFFLKTRSNPVALANLPRKALMLVTGDRRRGSGIVWSDPCAKRQAPARAPRPAAEVTSRMLTLRGQTASAQILVANSRQSKHTIISDVRWPRISTAPVWL
jgi:hypothetical protein